MFSLVGLDDCIYPCNYHYKKDLVYFHHSKNFSFLLQLVPSALYQKLSLKYFLSL